MDVTSTEDAKAGAGRVRAGLGAPEGATNDNGNGNGSGGAVAAARQVVLVRYRVTAALLLPPTMTPRGPITWVAPPQEDSLRQCREIDVRAAVRAALSDPPPPC